MAADCAQLREIEQEQCAERLTERTYHEFQTKYLDVFLRHIVRERHSSACLSGHITLAVSGRPRTAREMAVPERVWKTREVRADGREYIVTHSEFPGPVDWQWAKVVEDTVDENLCADDRQPDGRDAQAAAPKTVLVIPIILNLGEYASKRDSPASLLRQYDRHKDGADDVWGGHYSLLLVDHADRTVEYFEPNGSGAGWVVPVAPVLRAYIERRWPEIKRDGYDVHDPEDFCPRVSIQGLSQTSTCAYWSTLWAVLRLACPGVPRQVLVEDMVSHGKDWLVDLMQEWHCFVTDYSRRHRILEAAQLLQATAARELRGLSSQDPSARVPSVRARNHLVQAYNDALALYHDRARPEQSADLLHAALAGWHKLHQVLGDQRSSPGTRRQANELYAAGRLL